MDESASKTGTNYCARLGGTPFIHADASEGWPVTLGNYSGGRAGSPTIRLYGTTAGKAKGMKRNEARAILTPLSERELQVAVGIAQGKTPQKIAASLGLSVKTVSTFRARLFKKTNINSNAQLAILMFIARHVKFANQGGVNAAPEN